MIEASGRGILVFALKVLAIGAALYPAWYLGARPISIASGWGAAPLIAATAPVDLARSHYVGRELTFVLAPDDRTVRRNRLAPDALLEVTANALKYTFGLPFFLALVLASRPALWGWKALAGVGCLLAVAALGLHCEVILDLSRMRGASGEPFFQFAASMLELNAVGYQLASLVLPTVVPIMLWAAFDPGAIRALRMA